MALIFCEGIIQKKTFNDQKCCLKVWLNVPLFSYVRGQNPGNRVLLDQEFCERLPQADFVIGSSSTYTPLLFL